VTSRLIQIAYRNVKRNRRRSLATIAAISVGFAALTLFCGYTKSVYRALRTAAIVKEGLGHLTIYKEGWLARGSLEPRKYMLTRAEVDTITRVARAEPGVVLVSPKLNLAGLASNGKVSHIFIAEGVVPADFAALRKDGAFPTFLRADRPSGAEIGAQLAAVLDLHEGSQAALTTITLRGQMNALDFDVAHIVNTGVPDTNDKFVRLPFQLAQQLYETDGADRVMVKLSGYQLTEGTRKTLVTKLAAAGVPVEIKTWEELSVFFASTNQMLGMLLSFMGTIVLVIVVMTIVNTMGITVLERTREIGTLRAIGLRRGGTKALFAIEGCLLGAIGSVIGIVIHSVVWSVIALTRPTYTPPGFSEPVLFAVAYVPIFLGVLSVIMMLFALLAAIRPAARAARRPVVESLNYV
jgi:putative ABC transport system permease protein